MEKAIEFVMFQGRDENLYFFTHKPSGDIYLKHFTFLYLIQLLHSLLLNHSVPTVISFSKERFQKFGEINILQKVRLNLACQKDYLYYLLFSFSFVSTDFEIQPKILEVFVKEHKKELEDIEIKYHVEIPRKADGEKVSLKPKDSCTTGDYEQACNQFISLYRNTYQQLKMQRFSLKTKTNIIGGRRTISKMIRHFPVSVEIDKNPKLWCIYGEANNIEEALRFIEEEGFEINREREDEKGRHQKGKDVEDCMEVATPIRGIEHK